MNIKKLSLGAVLVTLLMTLLSLVSPTSSVKAETKKYVIATDITFAPFEYQDTNGEYVGIDIELMKSIAEAEGFEVEFKPLDKSMTSLKAYIDMDPANRARIRTMLVVTRALFLKIRKADATATSRMKKMATIFKYRKANRL